MAQIRTYLLIAAVLVGSGCKMLIQTPTLDERRIVRTALVKTAENGTPAEIVADDPSNSKRVKVLTALVDTQHFLHPDYRSAESFCRNVESYGLTAGARRRAGGWVVTTLGAIATGALTTLAAKDGDSGVDKSSWRSVGEGAGAGAAAVLTAAGAYLLWRGINATDASHKATAALGSMGGLSDLESDWKTCLAIRNQWLSSDDEAIKKLGSVGSD